MRMRLYLYLLIAPLLLVAWWLSSSPAHAEGQVYEKSGSLVKSETWGNGTYVLTGSIDISPGVTLTVTDSATVDLNGHDIWVGGESRLKVYDSDKSIDGIDSGKKATFINTSSNMSLIWSGSNRPTNTELASAAFKATDGDILVNAGSIERSTFSAQGSATMWIRGKYATESSFTGPVGVTVNNSISDSEFTTDSTAIVGGSFTGNTITKTPGEYFYLGSTSLSAADRFVNNTSPDNIWLFLQPYDNNNYEVTSHYLSGSANLSSLAGVNGATVTMDVIGTVEEVDLLVYGQDNEQWDWCAPECGVNLEMLDGSALANTRLSFANVYGSDTSSGTGDDFALRGVEAYDTVIDLTDKSATGSSHGQITKSTLRPSSITDSQVWAGPDGNTAIYGTEFTNSEVFALGAAKLSGLTLNNTNVSITQPAFGGKVGTTVQYLDGDTASSIYATDAYFDRVNLTSSSTKDGFPGDFNIKASYDGCVDPDNCDVTLQDRVFIMDPDGEFVAHPDSRVLFQEGTYSAMAGDVYPNGATWGTTGTGTGEAAAVEVDAAANSRAYKMTGSLYRVLSEPNRLTATGAGSLPSFTVSAPSGGMLRDSVNTLNMSASPSSSATTRAASFRFRLPEGEGVAFDPGALTSTSDCNEVYQSTSELSCGLSAGLERTRSERLPVVVSGDATSGVLDASVTSSGLRFPLELGVSEDFGGDTAKQQAEFEAEGRLVDTDAFIGGATTTIYYSRAYLDEGEAAAKDFQDIVTACSTGQPGTETWNAQEWLASYGLDATVIAARQTGRTGAKVLDFGATALQLGKLLDDFLKTGTAECSDAVQAFWAIVPTNPQTLAAHLVWDAMFVRLGVDAENSVEGFKEASRLGQCYQESITVTTNGTTTSYAIYGSPWTTADVNGHTLRCA